MLKRISMLMIPLIGWMMPVLAATTTGDDKLRGVLEFLGRVGQIGGMIIVFWGVLLLAINFNGQYAVPWYFGGGDDKNAAIKIIIIGGIVYMAGPILIKVVGL